MPPLQWDMPRASAPHASRFIRARRVIFGIALASFVLSFFHRTAPAAIAGELTRAFAINGAVLGTIAATYFYVYTLLQIPVGEEEHHRGVIDLVEMNSITYDDDLGESFIYPGPAWKLSDTPAGQANRAHPAKIYN